MIALICISASGICGEDDFIIRYPGFKEVSLVAGNKWSNQVGKSKYSLDMGGF
jgi:hypothetical protein